MRVLVACEYSGIVRDAFIRAGHEALSCDLLPSESSYGPHHQGDVLELLGEGWDLMIAHPPCTFLSNSGAGRLYLGKTKAEKAALGYQRDPERWANMEAGAEFFMQLWQAPIPRICIENPVMHGHGIERVHGRATQFVQPYEFGTPESKRTGLRLKNLPPLTPNDGWEKVLAYGKTLPKKQFERVAQLPPSPTRWIERSRTFPGIAQAMADQWGLFQTAKVLEAAA